MFFLKGPGKDETAHPGGTNGETNPDTVVLHVGQPARFLLLKLSTANPAALCRLTARPDSALTGEKDGDTTLPYFSCARIMVTR